MNYAEKPLTDHQEIDYSFVQYFRFVYIIFQLITGCDKTTTST